MEDQKIDKKMTDINKDPYRYAIKVVFCKWKPHILKGMDFDGATRFNSFSRRLGITEKVLADNLQELEADGLIIRTVYPEVPLRVEYSLSEAGKLIIPILESVYDWAWHQMKEKDMEIDIYGEMWHGYREKDLEFMGSIDKRNRK